LEKGLNGDWGEALPVTGDGEGVPTGPYLDDPTPKCSDLLVNAIATFLQSVKSPLLTQDPGFVSQVMAQAQKYSLDPRLFIAETLESGYGVSNAATMLDNPFGLLDGKQHNLDFSNNGSPAAGVAAAVVVEGTTLNNLINVNHESLTQMYSGLGGIPNKKTGTWTRPPAYCSVPGCPAFGAKLGDQIKKMGGDPKDLKYPTAEVGGKKCQ
jgi:hypothetical protein